MNVIFENLIFDFDDEIREFFLLFVNRIILAKNETELREAVEECAKRIHINKYFLYGYGKHHLWVKQRLYCDPNRTYGHRMMIVNF